MAARTARTAAAMAARSATWLLVMPRKLPNSRAVVPFRNPWYSATNSSPQASVKAWTMPVSADSLTRLLPGPAARPRVASAMTAAAAVQKAK